METTINQTVERYGFKVTEQPTLRQLQNRFELYADENSNYYNKYNPRNLLKTLTEINNLYPNQFVASMQLLERRYPKACQLVIEQLSNG